MLKVLGKECCGYGVLVMKVAIEAIEGRLVLLYFFIFFGCGQILVGDGLITMEESD